MNTHEVYINGMSTSLPMEVQAAMVHSIPGLENAEMLRQGTRSSTTRSIPTELDRTLRVKSFDGLYLAGQINGRVGMKRRLARVDGGDQCSAGRAGSLER